MEIFLMLLQAVVTIIVGYVGIKLKKREAEKEKEREESEAIKNGIRAVLRDRILQAYNHFSRIGKIQIEELENISNMYIAYHNLGGNGVVTSVYNKVLQIPHELKKEE